MLVARALFPVPSKQLPLPGQLRRFASLPLRVALGLVLGFAGCRSVKKEWDVPTGPAFEPRNYTSLAAIPASVQRVAVLPLHSGDWPATNLATLEAAFAAELVKVARFETVAVTRAHMREEFSSEQLLSSAALPADLLDRLRASHGADAILLQDLTHYSPYQPIAIGIRAKLVATADGRVLWSFDTIFDGAQPSVAVAAREYYLSESRPAHPLNNSAGIMQSPSRFAKYVAHAVFGTLPPRQVR